MLVTVIFTSGQFAVRKFRNAKMSKNWTRIVVPPNVLANNPRVYHSIYFSSMHNPVASAIITQAIHGDVAIVDGFAQSPLTSYVLAVRNALLSADDDHASAVDGSQCVVRRA